LQERWRQAQKGVRTVALLHDVDVLDKKPGFASKALERQGSWNRNQYEDEVLGCVWGLLNRVVVIPRVE
jgi:hypothetical protein